MDFGAMALIGIISGTFLVIALLKLGGPKVLWMEAPIDVFFTFAVPLMFAGTATSMVISFIAGVTVTCVFYILGGIMPTERIRFRKERGLPQLYWQEYPPKAHRLGWFARFVRA